MSFQIAPVVVSPCTSKVSLLHGNLNVKCQCKLISMSRMNRSFFVRSYPDNRFIKLIAVLGPTLFTIYVSPIASIVSSNGVDQQPDATDTHLLSSFPLHLYLADSAASSGVSLLFTAVSFTTVWFKSNQNSKSSVFQLLYGVPQETVLDPLLFILSTTPLSYLFL